MLIAGGGQRNVSWCGREHQARSSRQSLGGVTGDETGDSPTVISWVALIVAILALSASNFVALRRAKVGLDEYEPR
ncbi:MAG: hypothetical protein AMS18_01345 [Gemmatimonas sp. SG8_17]|nr:MAG: hypothetical protein AMS18_01345 [Gemmatimonas sp. SG8_17]